MACSRGKRTLNDDNESATQQELPFKRRRSMSLSPDIGRTKSGCECFQKRGPVRTFYELDRLNNHIGLQEFGAELQKAANTVFTGDQRSRYTKVEVILLSWEDEDPKLPVSLEIKELAAVFRDIYNFQVQEWLIPAEDSHNRLQSRILEFLGKSDPQHLKIVYYAGHGRLTNHGTPAWTSLRNSKKERCPTVKWSGIQNTLEESRSDVLILLDCCASGVCTTDEGNGVTELIAACAYNAIANGVGPFSFTHALTAKLRLMAKLPTFNVGYFYNAIFTEVQGWRIEDSRFKKAPIHLILSQNQELPRSICLSKIPKLSDRESLLDPALGHSQTGDAPLPTYADICKEHASSIDDSSPSHNSPLSQAPSSSSSSSISQVSEYPRLLFSVRLFQDIKPNDLSCGLFSEWLRQIPVSVDALRVEAGFASDSTLLIVSLPVSLMAYLSAHPAITLLGTTYSRNLMTASMLSSAVSSQTTSQPQEEKTEVVASPLGKWRSLSRTPKAKDKPAERLERPSSLTSSLHTSESYQHKRPPQNEARNELQQEAEPPQGITTQRRGHVHIFERATTSPGKLKAADSLEDDLSMQGKVAADAVSENKGKGRKLARNLQLLPEAVETPNSSLPTRSERSKSFNSTKMKDSSAYSDISHPTSSRRKTRTHNSTISPDTYHYEYYWTCCECGLNGAGALADWNDICLFAHRRCPNCPVERVKIWDRH